MMLKSAFAVAAFAAAAVFSVQAKADPLVTYTWTTTSEGYGPHVDQPSSATFQVPLSDVQAGTIPFYDVSNIELFYPGLTFDTANVSIIGFDFAAYVNPMTGSFIYQDDQQGLAVIASDSRDPNFSTFLSILVDNPVSGSVADQFNALDYGSPYAGYPTAGFWTASFPTTTPAVPELSTWAMMVLGFCAFGFLAYRRKDKNDKMAPNAAASFE